MFTLQKLQYMKGKNETYLYVSYQIKYGDEVSESFVVICKSDYHYIYKGTTTGLNKGRYDAFMAVKKMPKNVVFYKPEDLR